VGGECKDRPLSAHETERGSLPEAGRRPSLAVKGDSGVVVDRERAGERGDEAGGKRQGEEEKID